MLFRSRNEGVPHINVAKGFDAVDLPQLDTLLEGITLVAVLRCDLSKSMGPRTVFGRDGNPMERVYMPSLHTIDTEIKNGGGNRVGGGRFLLVLG